MTGAGNNTYLIIGVETGSAALIDAGVGEPRHLADLDDALRAGQARLASVLVTHGHHDHIGGAPALAIADPQATFAKLALGGAVPPCPLGWQGGDARGFRGALW